MAENEEQARARADPELLHQLDEAEASKEPVEAVFILRRPSGSVLAPDEVEKVTNEVLGRVQREDGSQVKDVNVFKNMGSFVVVGEPPLLRRLLDQPEIEAGIANRQPGSVDLLGEPAPPRGRNAERA
jgi:hypothetical protein